VADGGDMVHALAEPLLDTPGWDVTSSSTTISLGLLEDTRIQLGEQPAAAGAGQGRVQAAGAGHVCSAWHLMLNAGVSVQDRQVMHIRKRVL
jgi:hypothetical protein